MTKVITFKESLDEVYPTQRIETKRPTILDEWQFDIGSADHILRFERDSDLGKRTIRVLFGVKRGRNVSRNVEPVGNVKKYIATVFSCLEQAMNNPTKRMEKRRDGICLVIPDEYFDRMGPRIVRILTRLFRKTYNIHNAYFKHNEEGFMGIYMWKKGRQFTQVFSFEDALKAEKDYDQQEFGASKTITSTGDMEKVKSIDLDIGKDREISTEIEYQEDEEEDEEVEVEPLLQQRVEDHNTILDRVKLLGGKPIQEKYSKEDFEEQIGRSFFEVLIAKNLFRDQIKRSPGDPRPSYMKNKTTSLTDDIKISSDDYEKAYYYKMNRDAINEFFHENIYLVALNISGIKTGHTYDYFDSDYKRGSFSSGGPYTRLNHEPDFNIIPYMPDTFKESNFEEIIKICEEAEDIIRLTLPEGIFEKLVEISTKPKKSLINHLTTDGPDINEKKQMVLNLLASIDNLNIEPKYEEETNQKGNQTKISKSYDRILDSHIDHIIIDTRNSIENVDEYILFDQALPPALRDPMISDDRKYFEVYWADKWAMTGGTIAAKVAHESLSDYSYNNKLDSYYDAFFSKVPEEIRQKKQNEPDIKAIIERKDTIQNNFDAIYNKTQEFYKNKLKKKYDNYYVSLYRGLALQDNQIEAYVPSAVESWSTQLSTAKRFAKMMSDNPNQQVILHSEVPIQSVLATWETLEGFPFEEELQGKKEYMIFGGTFATTPIYIFDPDTKEKELMSLREWIEKMNESKKDEGKSIKIITPKTKEFKKLDQEGKLLYGNDPREFEIKEKGKSDDKD